MAETFAAAGIRTQLVHRPQLTALEIHNLGLDRRVRWIATTVQNRGDGFTSPEWIETLVGATSCPIVVIPSQ